LGITVWKRLGNILGSDHATCASSIFDYHWLAPDIRQPTSDHASNWVVRASWWVWNDKLYDSIGPSSRIGEVSKQKESRIKSSSSGYLQQLTAEKFHSVAPNGTKASQIAMLLEDATMSANGSSRHFAATQ